MPNVTLSQEWKQETQLGFEGVAGEDHSRKGEDEVQDAIPIGRKNRLEEDSGDN